MSWISLITGLLKLAGHLLDWLERRSAIREGERRAVLKQVEAIRKRVAIASEEERRVDALSDRAVDAALEEWYRD